MNPLNTSKNSLSGFALGLALVGEVARYCARQAAGGGRGAVGGDVARYAGGSGGGKSGKGGDAKPNSNGEHWVTIGGEPEGDKKHVGGTPVKIDGAGNIVAGPAWVAKAGITKLGGGKEGGEGGSGENGDSGAGGGATGGEAAPAGTTGKLNRETMNSLRRGAVLKDKDGKEWLPHSYRHGFLTAHPVVDGKAIVNKETAKTFNIDAAEHHGPKDDVYVTDRNLEDEEIAAHRAREDEKKKQQSPIAPEPAASTAPASPAPAASPKGKFEIPKYKRDNPPMVSSPTVLKRGVDVKIPHYDHDDLGRHIEEQKGTEYILPGLEQFRFAIIPPIGKVRIGAKGEKRLVEITSGTEVGHGTDENEVIRAAMARIQHHGGAEFLDKKLPEILKNHADLDSQMPLMSLEQLNEKRREHRNKKLAEAANSKAGGKQQQSPAPEAAPAPASPPTPQANTAPVAAPAAVPAAAPAAAPAPAAPPSPTATAPAPVPAPTPASTPATPSHITPETVPGKGSIVTDAAGREHVVTGSGGGYMFAAPIGDNGEVLKNRERAFNLKLGDRNSQAFATGRMHGVAQSKPASESGGGSGGSGKGAAGASLSASQFETPAIPPATAPVQSGTKSAEELAQLVDKKLLYPRAIEQAKKMLSITAADSPKRAEIQAEINQLQSRWDAEQPNRDARKKLENAGWRQSDYNEGQWYHSKTKRKASTVDAIRMAGLAENPVPAPVTPTPAPAPTSASPPPTAPAATVSETPAATTPTPPTAPTNASSTSGEGKSQAATPRAAAATLASPAVPASAAKPSGATQAKPKVTGRNVEFDAVTPARHANDTDGTEKRTGTEYSIPGYEGIRFVASKNSWGGYKVFEASTGLEVGNGGTQQAAIDDTTKKMDKFGGADAVRREVQNRLSERQEKQGQSSGGGNSRTETAQPSSSASAQEKSAKPSPQDSNFELPKYKRDNPPRVSQPTIVKKGVNVTLSHNDKKTGFSTTSARGTEYSLPGLEEFRFAVIPPSGSRARGDKTDAQLIEMSTGALVGWGPDAQWAIDMATRKIMNGGGAKVLEEKIRSMLAENASQKNRTSPASNAEQNTEKAKLSQALSLGIARRFQKFAGFPTIPTPEKALYSMVASAFSSRFQATAATATQATTLPHQRKGN